MINKKSLEIELEKAAVRLVEQMILNVFDKIRIKKSWKKKRISQKMIEKKRSNIADIGAWLESDGAEFWFRMYGNCTNKDGFKMLNDFKIIVRKSTDFLDLYEAA